MSLRLALLAFFLPPEAGASQSILVKPKMQWTDPARLPKGGNNNFGPGAYEPEPMRVQNNEDDTSNDFNLNSATFRTWISELCKQPPDPWVIVESRKKNGLWTTVRKPKNALATLLLLLENYELDVTYLSECTEARKLFPTSCMRGKAGPVPGRELESELAGDNSPADTFAQFRSAMRLEKRAIRQLYGRLKETSFLDGSQASVEIARKIRHAAEYTSTCRLRSFEEKMAKRKTSASPE